MNAGAIAVGGMGRVLGTVDQTDFAVGKVQSMLKTDVMGLWAGMGITVAHLMKEVCTTST